MAKKYFVTYPIVMGCLGLSLWVYFAYHRIQKKTDDNYPVDKSLVAAVPPTFVRMVPSAGYSLGIIPMNLVYSKLATWMTKYGKHGTHHGFT